MKGRSIFKLTAVLNAASKDFDGIPDTVEHDGIVWGQVSRGPNHGAWFHAGGRPLYVSADWRTRTCGYTTGTHTGRKRPFNTSIVLGANPC
jgi:hypothetical protein